MKNRSPKSTVRPWPPPEVFFETQPVPEAMSPFVTLSGVPLPTKSPEIVGSTSAPRATLVNRPEHAYSHTFLSASPHAPRSPLRFVTSALSEKPPTHDNLLLLMKMMLLLSPPQFPPPLSYFQEPCKSDPEGMPPHWSLSFPRGNNTRQSSAQLPQAVLVPGKHNLKTINHRYD